MVVYDLPLNEVVFDFYDRLKSVTKGYASFDYEISQYVQDNLVKMQILVNDVAQATIVVPAAGSQQESVVTTLQIPVVQEDAVAITVSSGAPEDPIVRLTLQDW